MSEITMRQAINAMANAGMDGDAIDNAFRSMPKAGEVAGEVMYQYDVVVAAVEAWMESRNA